MFGKILTVFCIVALALTTLNSQNPEKFSHAVSLVDNYSYKAHLQAPRRLATTNWDSKNQRCYLNTNSNATVQLTRLENEQNCKDFLYYHKDYFWDGASQSCFNYYYGTKEESYSPYKFQCDYGTGILVAVILGPILGFSCLVCMCVACYKLDCCKESRCCCECFGRCCQSRNQNDEIQGVQETNRNLKTRVITLEKELDQQKMNTKKQNEKIELQNVLNNQKLRELELERNILKANQQLDLHQKQIEQPNILIEYQPEQYSQPLTVVKKYEERLMVPQVLPPNQPQELADIKVSLHSQEIQEFEITFTNPIVEKVYKELGPFYYYDEVFEQSLGSREKRQKQLLENGGYYTGEWLIAQNIKEGRGIQIWPDGSVYEGYWKANMANGKGRLIHVDCDVYTGYWKNDKADGQGVYLHADGTKYDGLWQDDKQHGFGVETWPDGAKYQGDYVQGKKQGYGHFTWADKAEYKGNFFDNDIQGHGVYNWSNGSSFVGSWKNNKMEGFGTFKWPDGRSYVGEYVNDKKEGDGIFRWPDGRIYNGKWRDGKQDGEGIYTTSKGSKKGRWENGKRVEWL